MTAFEFAEHLSYWDDEVKAAAHTAAFAEVICDGDEVLDLGSGTGLLGCLAAQAGAAKVWSFDSGSIIVAARQIAERKGLADRIGFGRSQPGSVELPAVEVLMCDQIGGMAFDAGVLDTPLI